MTPRSSRASARRMVVGIVTPHGFPSDQEIRVAKLAKSFEDAGFKAEVYCPGGGASPDASSLNVEVVRLTGSGRGRWARLLDARLPLSPVWIWRLYREFGARGVDAVVTRDLRLSLPAMIAARLRNIPCVLDIGEHYPGMMAIVGKQRLADYLFRNDTLIRALEAITVRTADWVWVVVDENRRRLLRYNRNIDTISNFPDASPATVDGAEQTTYGDRPVTLVSLGLIDNIRGLDLAISAMAIAVAARPNIRLLIYGDGPYRPELERQVRELGLSSTVLFGGWVPGARKYDVLAMADVGLLLHRVCELCENTIPNKLFDYMTVGLPTLATNLGPVRNIIEADDCGVIVADNREAVAEAIVALVTDVKLRRRLGRNGRAAVKAKYRWSDEGARAAQRVQALIEARERV